MRYTPATVAKAIMAFLTAFGGAAATSTPHDAIGWAGCVGAGVVAFAAVFVTPNKPSDAPQAPADQVITGLQDVIAARDHATAEIERVRNAARDIAGTVPVVGPLAQQVIDSIRLP